MYIVRGNSSRSSPTNSKQANHNMVSPPTHNRKNKGKVNAQPNKVPRIVPHHGVFRVVKWWLIVGKVIVTIEDGWLSVGNEVVSVKGC